MKPLIMSLIVLVFTGDFALASVKFGEIEKNAEGSSRPNYLDKNEAAALCASKGGRLPKAREQVQFLISRGAAIGIKEISEFETEEAATAAGYYLVSTIEVDGSNDKFYVYFDYGYRNKISCDSTDAVLKNWHWSSSMSAKYTYLPYVLDGLRGYVVPIQVEGANPSLVATICVQDSTGN